MLEARRAVWLQVTTFTVVIASFLLLWHFFPIIDFVVALQQRVLGLGAWSAICYPLLLAGCNVLLLPGGILCVGGGFFFGLWLGFFFVLLGNCIVAAIVIFYIILPWVYLNAERKSHYFSAQVE